MNDSNNNNNGFKKSFSWRRQIIINGIDAYDVLSLKTSSDISKKSWIEMLHGLEYSIQIKNKKSKIIWLIFIVIAVFISIYLTVITINEFFEDKTVTLNTIRRKNEILYHGISICPKYSDTFNYINVKNKILSIRNDLDNKTINDLIIYALAGGGFDNYNNLIKDFHSNKSYELDNILNDIIIYFGSLKNFYNYIFEEENFKCEDFFEECIFGNDVLNCCELFQPAFVLIRGKCYKLKKIYQRDPDEISKLRLVLKPLSSIFLNNNKSQEQLVIYNSPRSESIGLFPRYYIHNKDWNRFRFTKRMYKLFHNKGNCNNDKNYKGLSICYTNGWIKQKIHDKFNCTFFYINNNQFNLPICSPKIIVENYEEIMTNKPIKINCNQACTREEVETTLITKPFSSTLANIKDYSNPKIHIEMSYERLQEYIFEDVLVTTASGFISELGGHTGLFVGFTIITIIQALFFLVRYIFKEFSKMKLENVNGVKF
uniref:Acid-sensing ion channel 1 n=1 Tax=Strongyloides stercoralis TaxID=6248 RepID=A0A0K0E3X4_STRER